MIKILILFLTLVFIGCGSNPIPKKINTIEVSKKTISDSFPSWYFKIPLNKYEVIGYGSGLSMEEAKTNARSDISKSLIVTIKSELNTSHTIKEHGNDFNETKEFQSHITEYTNIILADAKLKKYQKINGTFYVALSYINLPLTEKIYLKLKDTKLKPIDKRSIYNYSLFSERLNEKFKYIPSYSLFFKDGLYYVNINNKLFVINNSDLPLFFISKENKNIDFKISSKQLKSGDFFYFTIESKLNGYISLIQVDEDGRVIVHLDNLENNSNHKFTYPNLEIYNGLEAGIINEKNNVQENYILAICSNKLNLSSYEYISLDYNTNETSLRFTSLDKVISRCEYNAIIIHVQKGNLY